MRLISQEFDYDVPYELSALSVDEVGDGMVILAKLYDKWFTMAKYSNLDRVDAELRRLWSKYADGWKIYMFLDDDMNPATFDEEAPEACDS